MSQGLTGSRNPKPMGNVKAALNLVKDRRRLQLGGEGVPEVAGRIGDLGVTGLPVSLGSWLTTEAQPQSWPQRSEEILQREGQGRED